MVEYQKRQIAYKVSIKSILENPFVKDNSWQPSHVLINTTKVARVNLIVIILEKESTEKNDNFFVDDSTGRIFVRSFEQKFDQINIGDLVNIIGRLREFNNEVYIVPEIMRKIIDPSWMEVRKKELSIESAQNIIEIMKPHEIKPKIEEIPKDIPNEVIQFIKDKDQGEGVEFVLLLDSNIENIEKKIDYLKKEGYIYEIKPGKYKVLD